MTRERIVSLLWSEHAADAGRRLLSESLYIIRRELGEDVILTIGDELTLNPDRLVSDVGAFQSAIAVGDSSTAVTHYAGPFLDGWYVSDAPEFERWVEKERTRLTAGYASALEALAEARERSGDWQSASRHWGELAAVDPYSTRAVMRKARCLAISGDRAAALQALAAHETRLREDLDVGPDADLMALADQIRSERAAPPSISFEPLFVKSSETNDPYDRPLVPFPESAHRTVGEPARPTTRRRAEIRVALLAAAMVIASFAVGLRWLPALLGSANSTPQRDPPDPRRIAVLYFDDHSAGHTLGYLADGLTEELIRQLSGVGALKVIPRNGVKPYRLGTVPLDSIVRALNVGMLVEGSVTRFDDTVRLNVRLVDGESLEPIKDEIVVKQPLTNVFALEDELANQISARLRHHVGEEIRLKQARGGTRNERALDLLLRAEREQKNALQLEASPNAIDVRAADATLGRADSLLALAETLDSRWAQPTIARGWLWYSRALLAIGEPRVRSLETAVTHAERALRRDEGSAEALELRGTLRWRLSHEIGRTSVGVAYARDAERDLRAALSMDSTRASGWATLSRLLRDGGSFAEADVFAQRALTVDAYLENAGDVISQLYRTPMMLGDASRAKYWCEYGQRTLPDDWRFIECQLNLMRLDLASADPKRAWEIVAKLDELDPPAKARAAGRPYNLYYRRLVAAAVSARHGQPDSARAVLAWALRETSSDPELRVDVKFDAALLHFVLGERDTGLRLLNEYLIAKPEFAQLITRDPVLKSLGVIVPHTTSRSSDSIALGDTI